MSRRYFGYDVLAGLVHGSRGFKDLLSHLTSLVIRENGMVFAMPRDRVLRVKRDKMDGGYCGVDYW